MLQHIITSVRASFGRDETEVFAHNFDGSESELTPDMCNDTNCSSISRCQEIAGVICEGLHNCLL